jgi:hypothetical protein
MAKLPNWNGNVSTENDASFEAGRSSLRIDRFPLAYIWSYETVLHPTRLPAEAKQLSKRTLDPMMDFRQTADSDSVKPNTTIDRIK